MAWLQTTFFEPVVLPWMDGACIRPVELTPRPRGTLRVHVEGDPEGIEPFTRCFDAHSYKSWAAEDTEVHEDVILLERGASTRCLVSLTRRLEMGTVRGQDRAVEVREGQVTEITLEAPELPRWTGTSPLGPGSPLVDVGQPALTDEDGTRRDIGAYGGTPANP